MAKQPYAKRKECDVKRQKARRVMLEMGMGGVIDLGLLIATEIEAGRFETRLHGLIFEVVDKYGGESKK